jgi:hypothetical protein
MSAKTEKIVRLAGIFDWLGGRKKFDSKLIQVLSRVILDRHPELKGEVEAAAASGNPRAFNDIRVPEFSRMKPQDVRMAMISLKMNPRRNEMDKEIQGSAETIIRQIKEISEMEPDTARRERYREESRREEAAMRPMPRTVTEIWESPTVGQKLVAVKLDHRGQEIDRRVQADPGWRDFSRRLEAAIADNNTDELRMLTSGLRGRKETFQPTKGFMPETRTETITSNVPDYSFLMAS